MRTSVLDTWAELIKQKHTLIEDLLKIEFKLKEFESKIKKYGLEKPARNNETRTNVGEDNCDHHCDCVDHHLPLRVPNDFESNANDVRTRHS